MEKLMEHGKTAMNLVVFLLVLVGIYIGFNILALGMMYVMSALPIPLCVMGVIIYELLK